MANNAPVENLRDGRLQAAIWANTGAESKTFHSVTLTRSYKEEGGDWKETSQLDEADLLRAANLLTQAYNKIKDIEHVKST